MGKRERQREKKLKKAKDAKVKKKRAVMSFMAPVPVAGRPGKARGADAATLPASALNKRVARYDALVGTPSVLVLGDGDFSFGKGLLKHRGGTSSGITVTSYDSQAEVLAKYPKTGGANLRALGDAGVGLLHGVDATRLAQTLGNRKGHKWDRIVWNFPHTGQQRAHVNRNVISSFLAGSRAFLRPRGQVHVTIKLAPPYDRYGLGDKEGPVLEGTCMAVFDELPFDAALFPGYAHQTTLADAKGAFAARSKVKCCTYVYVPVPGSPPVLPPPTAGSAGVGGSSGDTSSPAFSFAAVIAAKARAVAAAAGGASGGGGGGGGKFDDNDEGDDDGGGFGGSDDDSGGEGEAPAEALSKNQKRRRAKKASRAAAAAEAAAGAGAEAGAGVKSLPGAMSAAATGFQRLGKGHGKAKKLRGPS